MVYICREKMGKAKAQFDLKLDRVVSDNKKSVLSMSTAKGGLKKMLDTYLLKAVT